MATKKAKASVKKFAGYLTHKQAWALLRQKFSFSVKFTRNPKIKEVLDSQGSWVPATKQFVSGRRFGTSGEATKHGRRFAKLEGHKSFRIVKVSDKPNAFVNTKTGRTNPITGRARLGR